MGDAMFIKLTEAGKEKDFEIWVNTERIVCMQNVTDSDGGGQTSAGLTNDVWSSTDGVSWSAATTAAAFPIRRPHTWDNSISRTRMV